MPSRLRPRVRESACNASAGSCGLCPRFHVIAPWLVLSTMEAQNSAKDAVFSPAQKIASYLATVVTATVGVHEWLEIIYTRVDH